MKKELKLGISGLMCLLMVLFWSHSSVAGCWQEGEGCWRDDQCCSGVCEYLKCTACSRGGDFCSTDMTCCTDSCGAGILNECSYCQEQGQPCTSSNECCTGTCNNNQCGPPRYWYNFPSYAKVKVDRNPDPAKPSWLYLEFKWEKDQCPPNFPFGMAVEFQINIRPKCFLQPPGGRDNRTVCKDVMGFGKYNLPGGDHNCYVDVWNYWLPPKNEVVGLIEAACGDLDWAGELCAKQALPLLEENSAGFAVGVYDGSYFKAGKLYSIRYPVQLNDSPECKDWGIYSDSIGPHCAGYGPPAPDGSSVHNERGRAWVTMQVFRNTCDLSCDIGNSHYSCPQLIGIDVGGKGCNNADKTTDFWLNRLCVPTDDWVFTPGFGTSTQVTVVNPQKDCITEKNSSDLRTLDICCPDRDNDKWFGPENKQVATYGTRTGDCNDANSTINPGELEIPNDGIDQNCDGTDSAACPSGNGLYCGQLPDLNPDYLYSCENGVYTLVDTCNGLGCQVNSPGIHDACKGCSCQSGVCCDGCTYKPSTEACNTVAVYQCQGPNPGDDAQWAPVTQYCSGTDAMCSGSTTQGPWQTQENCFASEVCQMSGGTSFCAPCQNAFLSGASPACYNNPMGSGNPTLCLSLKQVSGALWQYQVCKQSGSFQDSYDYYLRDENLNQTFTLYTESGGSCSTWRDVDLSYVQGYGPVNGAGLIAYVSSPSGCTASICQYWTGQVTVYKQQQCP
jgi:hypothetical protein